MRTHSRQNLRTINHKGGIPRTLTGQKLARLSLKQSQIRVGKYKYDPNDELGRGFSGNVFKAVQIVKQHKRYAIKVVNLKKFKGSSLEMLQAQIDIHSKLNHEHIVKLHEVIKTTQNYYLVMEYCPHGNLNQYIAQKKQLSQANAIQIMKQIHQGYKYLLEEGIIHRDIKPANILRVGNKWKLSDFGFATRARLGFKDRVNVGTPLYMAPETLRRNYYSYKSDFYAIGIVLFQMLAGHTPHQALSERQLLQKVVTQITVPGQLKHAKLVDFFVKSTVVSDNKRLSKEQFTAYQFLTPASALNSNCNSFMSVQHNRVSRINDESTLNRNNSSTEVSSKVISKEGSKVHWQSSSHTSKQYPLEQLKSPKNPMLTNHQRLTSQFNFVQHCYNLIQNLPSLLSPNRDMLTLTLFKLLLKLLRLLCDKSQNYLKLSNWQEYQQCKLYLQLYQELAGWSQNYQKEYLEFIKGNDIKVIRAVNRKFPELCNTQPLTSRFYDNYKMFVSEVMKEQSLEVDNLMAQGDNNLGDKIEALKNLYLLYRVGQLRSESAIAGLTSQRFTLLQDYNKSTLAHRDYSALKRKVRQL